MKATAGEVYTVYNQYLKRYTACQVAYIAPPDTVSKQPWAVILSLAVSYPHLDVYKRQGHVLPDVRRYAIQRTGGRERNPVCLLPCHSHCRSPVPQSHDGQAFSE